MTIGILATGDELIHGDTLNTNSQEIAHTLSSEGFPLGLQMTCSDKASDIVSCLTFLADQHDIIIVIGGLGPTTDDLTRFALASFTQSELVEHQEALTHIKNRLHAANVAINAGNLQQCLFPKTARLLPNPHGSALGCCFDWNNKLLFLLPGPPRECLPMLHHYIIPLLQTSQRSKKQLLKWRIFGLAESEIAQTLEDALKELDCQTGYRLDIPYIEFKVRCTEHLVDKVKNIVDPILAPHIISTVEKKSSAQLQELIAQNNQPITIIDEATGGLLETLLVKPGLHHLVHFTDRYKTPLLFHLSGLAHYWDQKGPMGSTELTIQYSNQKQQGTEIHKIPYRSPLVVHYAAEWLSFRLIQLINQLHQSIT